MAPGPSREPLPASSNPRRLLSLDALRGLTVAAMILVNNPGTWRAVYPPLRHADWHGWTLTDGVFPFFVFIVGVAVPIALTVSPTWSDTTWFSPEVKFPIKFESSTRNGLEWELVSYGPKP